MSDALASVVDDEVKRLVNEAHARALETLRERRELLDRLSRVLMASEVIEGADLKAYAEGRQPIPEPEERADGEQTEPLPSSGPDILGSPTE